MSPAYIVCVCVCVHVRVFDGNNDHKIYTNLAIEHTNQNNLHKWEAERSDICYNYN